MTRLFFIRFFKLRWIDFLRKHWGKTAVIFALISGMTAYLGGFEKAVAYYNNWQETRSLPFRAEEYGVLVCYFDGEDEYKRYTSKEIVNTLNARFRELNMQKAQTKHDIYVFSKKIIASHDEANSLGMKYNADLVIWGSVSKDGIQPNIRFVDNSDAFRAYTGKEMTIFKESLYNVASYKSNRNISYFIRKAELTDEPVALVSFVIAKRYMDENNFAKAIEYFQKAIPLEKTPYINNEPTYFSLARCYYSIGDFPRAEETLLKHTNYKNDDNLLALIGIIRHLRSSIPEHLYENMAKLWIKSSPKDWEFLDQLYLNGLTEKQLTASKPRQHDSVDELIETKLKDSLHKPGNWSFLQLVRAQENKDYTRFKQLHSELFKTADLDDQIILAMVSISVDSKLASESIQKIRSVHGDSLVLSLLEALNCMATREIELAKALIEKHSVLEKKSLLGRTMLAAYYSTNSDYNKSLEYLDQLVAEVPKATFYRKLRADINYYLQKSAAAKEDYELYLIDHPNDTKVLYRLAILSTSETQYTETIEYIQKLFAQPVNEDLHFAQLIDSILFHNPETVPKTFLDDEHKNGIKAVFKLLNQNDVNGAKAKIIEFVNNDQPTTLAAKYLSFYFYVHAIVSLLENDFSTCHFYLLNAFAEYPTEELKTLIFVLSNTDHEHVTKDKLFLAGKDAFTNMIKNNHIATAEAYESAAGEYTELCYLWNRAGIFRILAKEQEKAELDYRNALLCEPETKGLHTLYADIVKVTDCNLAISHYSRSIEIDGDSISAFNGLSQCYAKLGNKALADEYFSKYRKLYFENGGNPINFFFNQQVR